MPITELDNLAWLAHWYRAQCDGSWENTRGLRLEPHLRTRSELTGSGPLDRGTSPEIAHGWQLTIALPLTLSPGTRTRSLLLEANDGGWLACSLTPECFVGRGDAAKVEQIIGVFRRWIEQRAWSEDETDAASNEIAPVGLLELVSSPSS